MRWLRELRRELSAHAGGAADLIWPPWCPRCHARAIRAREHFCEGCWSALRPLRPADRMWALEEGPGELSAFAAFAVDSLFLDALATSKYRRFRAVGHRLVAEATAVLAPHVPPGTLVPVPLRADKRRERGFNQPEDFAHALAAASGGVVAPEWLVRTRGGKALAGLPRDARERAVRGAFSPGASLPPEPGPVVLVDDVVTTGSTARACAAVLRSAGASRVFVAAMGRAFASSDAPSLDLAVLGRF